MAERMVAADAHNEILSKAASILGAVFLAVALFTSGLMVAELPMATQALGQATADWDHGVYPEEDMASLAQAVRAYAIDGTEGSDLLASIEGVMRANPNAVPTLFDPVVNGEASLADFLAQPHTPSEQRRMERFTLDASAISHLHDCTPLFAASRIAFCLGAVAAAASFAVAWRSGDGNEAKRRIGRACVGAGVFVMAFFIVFGGWAALDFDSLFTAFHGVLFSQGNWTFAADSLLIRLVPEPFWIAMAALWAATTLLACIGAIALGRRLAR